MRERPENQHERGDADGSGARTPVSLGIEALRAGGFPRYSGWFSAIIVNPLGRFLRGMIIKRGFVQKNPDRPLA
jgi:hypothetical protein